MKIHFALQQIASLLDLASGSRLPRSCSGLIAKQVARPVTLPGWAGLTGGGMVQLGPNAEDERARRYRHLATELRARADAMTQEGARQGLLQAASVWDRLADFADRRVNLFDQSIPPERHLRS